MHRPASIVLALLLALGAGHAAAREGVVRLVAKGTFEAVKDNVLLAIEERGLVVDRVSHVGDMLDRTGKDVGSARRVYEKAEVLEFCSARVSREMMEADPHHLVFCPYTIAIYTLPGDAGRVHLAYRRPPKAKGMDAVDELLAGILRDATK